MKKIIDFYQLDAWKYGHKLAILVYQLTKNFPKSERFGVIDQLRRAASSVTANLAEGFGRFTFADKTHFYFQARGSLKEVQNFLLLSKDLKYTGNKSIKSIWNLSKDCERLINGLIRSTKKHKQSS